MAKSKTSESSPKTGEAHTKDKMLHEKRRELLETRLRWKIADETVRRVTDERRALRARIVELTADLGGAAAEEP